MAKKPTGISIDDMKVVGETDADKFEADVIKSVDDAKEKKKSTKKTDTKSTKKPTEAKGTTSKTGKVEKKTEDKAKDTKRAATKTTKTAKKSETKSDDSTKTVAKAEEKTVKKTTKTAKAEETKKVASKSTKTTKKTTETSKKETKPAVEKKSKLDGAIADTKTKEEKAPAKTKKASKKVEKVEPEKSAAEVVAEVISKKKTDKTEAKKDETPKKKETKKTEAKGEPKEVKKTATKKIVNNEGIDLLVSFDTTGSMYPVLSQVRREVSKLVNELYETVHDIRIGIIAHGDYCDAKKPYTIRIMDFTTDIEEITKFINDTAATYGGDSDECYELVLNQARTTVNWGEKRNKVFVLIGDANPHAPNYPDNKNKLDWHNEAGLLGEMGVKVFAVHALSYYRSSSKSFYTEVAKKTDGTYLTLDQFSEVTDLIRATCYSQYAEEQLNDFVSIIRDSGKLSNSLARNINRLYGREVIEGIPEDYTPARTKRTGTSSRYKTDDTLVQADGLVPIAPGRFQTMEVEENCDIRGFVEANGIHFVKGHAFYELTKVETVQQYKEVILQDRKTGEMFNGSQVREYLGLKPQIAAGGEHEKLYAKDAKDFRIFVQSTSVNRKLIGGTVMLYEIADD